MVHEAQAWAISSLVPRACPLLWVGERDTGTQHRERTSGFGEHLGAGASGHREVTVNQWSWPEKGGAGSRQASLGRAQGSGKRWVRRAGALRADAQELAYVCGTES